MQSEKDPKKLKAEELEKRVAPAALVVDSGSGESGSGGSNIKGQGKDAK